MSSATLEQFTVFMRCINNLSMQFSPEQVAHSGSTTQLLVDENLSSMSAVDGHANRDDFTATAKISEWALPPGGML